MSPEIKDALESACDAGGLPNGRIYRDIEVQRKPISAQRLRFHLIAFLQDVPEDLSVRELLDELRDNLHVAERP